MKVKGTEEGGKEDGDLQVKKVVVPGTLGRRRGRMGDVRDLWFQEYEW